jgi:hypothetical protein
VVDGFFAVKASPRRAIDFLGAGVAGEESRVVGAIVAPGSNSDENVREPFKLKRTSDEKPRPPPPKIDTHVTSLACEPLLESRAPGGRRPGLRYVAFLQSYPVAFAMSFKSHQIFVKSL